MEIELPITNPKKDPEQEEQKDAIKTTDGQNSNGTEKKSLIPKTSKARLLAVAGGLSLLLLVGLALVVALSSGSEKKINSLEVSEQSNIDLPENNNSAGYLQSPPADFSGHSLDLGYSKPEWLKTSYSEAKLTEQISLQNGFMIMGLSVDRDYRGASEFNYKKVAEAGDEIVRVNFLVGNATEASMPIGYNDLALYGQEANGRKFESERVPEDAYSPKNGQSLGGKQTTKISLHYRVKRDSSFFITKTVAIKQPRANEKKGQEKMPILSLKINLV